MNNLPNIISTKDLMYICDMFNWHLVAAKKLTFYSAHVTNEDCIKKLDELTKMHYKVCEDLINLLESENS